MSAPLYLFGGGTREAAYIRTWLDFRRACAPEARIALVLVEQEGLQRCEEERRWMRPLLAVGVRPEQLAPVWVGAGCALDPATLAEAGAVVLAGGAPPALHAALCVDLGWRAHVAQHALPLAAVGGAAVLMAEHALVGGWLRALPHQDLVVAARDVAEGIDYLQVRLGAGLVPFTLETHAAQLGTLTRLAQAALDGAVDGGWAIDEDTALRIEGDRLRVLGLGQAWQLHRVDRSVLRLNAHPAGTEVPREAW